MTLVTANKLLGEALSALWPGAPKWLLASAFLIATVLIVTIALLLLLIALFFDFIADAWKVVIALGVDVMKYYALTDPRAGIAAGLIGAAIFIWLSDARFWKWPFAILSLATGVLAFWWNGLIISILLGLVPINTVLMFIAAIID